MKNSLIILLFLCSICFGQFAPHQKPMLGRQVNKAHQLGDFVGCWLMNEGAGSSAADLSGNENEGSITGDVTWDVGKYGAILDLPGSDDYITIPHSQSFAFPGEFTIHLRGRCDADNDGMFLYHYDAGTASGYYIQYEKDDDKIYAVLFTGGAIICTSDSAVTLGQAYDITFTRDGAGLCTLWIDAVAQADTETKVGTVDSTDPIYLGCDRSQTKDLDGSLEYLYFYNRAVTASEISQLYSEPFCMFKDPLPVTMMYDWAVAAPAGQVIMISAVPIILLAGCLLYRRMAA